MLNLLLGILGFFYAIVDKNPHLKNTPFPAWKINLENRFGVFIDNSDSTSLKRSEELFDFFSKIAIFILFILLPIASMFSHPAASVITCSCCILMFFNASIKSWEDVKEFLVKYNARGILPIAGYLVVFSFVIYFRHELNVDSNFPKWNEIWFLIIEITFATVAGLILAFYIISILFLWLINIIKKVIILMGKGLLSLARKIAPQHPFATLLGLIGLIRLILGYFFS